jgi:hypothetical protein
MRGARVVLQNELSDGIEVHLHAEFLVDGSLCLFGKKQGRRLEELTGEDVSECFLTVKSEDVPGLFAVLSNVAGQVEDAAEPSDRQRLVLERLRHLYDTRRLLGLSDCASFLDRTKVPYERYST